MFAVLFVDRGNAIVVGAIRRREQAEFDLGRVHLAVADAGRPTGATEVA